MPSIAQIPNTEQGEKTHSSRHRMPGLHSLCLDARFCFPPSVAGSWRGNGLQPQFFRGLAQECAGLAWVTLPGSGKLAATFKVLQRGFRFFRNFMLDIQIRFGMGRSRKRKIQPSRKYEYGPLTPFLPHLV
jgi:hypothetical protein